MTARKPQHPAPVTYSVNRGTCARMVVHDGIGMGGLRAKIEAIGYTPEGDLFISFTVIESNGLALTFAAPEVWTTYAATIAGLR